MNPYIQMGEAVGAEIEVYRSKGNFGSVHNVPSDEAKQMTDALAKAPCPEEIFINGEVHDVRRTGK